MSRKKKGLAPIILCHSQLLKVLNKRFTVVKTEVVLHVSQDSIVIIEGRLLCYFDPHTIKLHTIVEKGFGKICNLYWIFIVLLASSCQASLLLLFSCQDIQVNLPASIRRINGCFFSFSSPYLHLRVLPVAVVGVHLPKT